MSEELKAQPAAVEVVEVRGLQWLDTGHYRKNPPQFGYNPHDWNPLMTVAQHNRIMAATVPGNAQVVGRVHHNEDHEEPVRAVLNSIGRQLPDNAPLYTHPATVPAGCKVVPVELLERTLTALDECAHLNIHYEAAAELRAILEVKP